MRGAAITVFLLAFLVPAAQGDQPPSGEAEDREAGDLLVPGTPEGRREAGAELRLRTHVEGGLVVGEPRIWVGPPVPTYVALKEGTLELTLLDATPEGRLAFYRDPYGGDTCRLAGANNCSYLARLYAEDGSFQWSLSLDRFLSRPDHLEIQDIRLDRGTLYFNEACQSYAREAKGRCSALVALDPVAAKVLWRTKPLTSNGRFVVQEDVIVAGYGFTTEQDFIHLVDRRTGRIVDKMAVASAPQAYQLDAQGRVVGVVLSEGQRHGLTIVAGKRPKLELRPLGKASQDTIKTP